MRLAFFGGIYSNSLALEAALRDATGRGADAYYCLGDMGAFGPHPDRAIELLREAGAICIQGNYDDSIGNDLEDCQCGYTDPRDNHFAKLSYDYTYSNTSAENRAWLRELPVELRVEADGLHLLLCHGSPRMTNEFLWESTTSTHFLEKLCGGRDADADIVLGTHTGIHWQRELKTGRRFVNVGVLGRPENDGTTCVWYTLISTGEHAKYAGKPNGAGATDTETTGGEQCRYDVEFVPVYYDHERLAAQMRAEKIPNEFIETILTGWWTTCLEVLPAKERGRGYF